DAGGARARVHLGLGRPLLLGLSHVPRRPPPGRRGGVPAVGAGRPPARVPDHADVRRQRRESPPAELHAARRCGAGASRRGAFLYDALLEFIPLYHVYTPRAVPFARFFSHLSHPAPGRGSSGVHESGFGRWDPATLSLSKRDGLIPTLMVVDDTFTGYREQMAAVIAQAKAWAGL